MSGLYHKVEYEDFLKRTGNLACYRRATTKSKPLKKDYRTRLDHHINHTFSCTSLSDKSVGINTFEAGRCRCTFGADSIHCCNQIQKLSERGIQRVLECPRTVLCQVASCKSLHIMKYIIYKITNLNHGNSDLLNRISSSVPWLHHVSLAIKSL